MNEVGQLRRVPAPLQDRMINQADLQQVGLIQSAVILDVPASLAQTNAIHLGARSFPVLDNEAGVEYAR